MRRYRAIQKRNYNSAWRRLLSRVMQDLHFMPRYLVSLHLLLNFLPFSFTHFSQYLYLRNERSFIFPLFRLLTLEFKSYCFEFENVKIDSQKPMLLGKVIQLVTDSSKTAEFPLQLSPGPGEIQTSTTELTSNAMPL